MCITFFCIEPTTNPLIKFIMGFNREEQTERNTLQFAPFKQDKNIYAGRDLTSGGTWLGVNIETGVLVFLTNFSLDKQRMGLSRGKLVYHFLKTQLIPKEKKQNADAILMKEMQQTVKRCQEYSAFNLTVCNLRTRKTIYLCSERDQLLNKPIQLKHNLPQGICNSDIQTVWPKTALGLGLFSKIIQQLGQINEVQILSKIKEVCNNKTRFSLIDDDESSIFVQPYLCIQEKTQRRTKSTFMLLLLEKQEYYELVIKEITYKNNNIEQEVNYRLPMQK